MNMSGGYTEYRKVTDEDLAVFNATNFPVGVGYATPEEVATQVVNGINYRFKTIQTLMVQNPPKGENGVVEIYKSSDDKIEFKGFIPANN